MELSLRDIRETKKRYAGHKLAIQISLLASLLLLMFRTRTVITSHISKLERLLTYLASIKLVMEEPTKVALLLVVLFEDKDYTAVVSSLKTLGDQSIIWNYTLMRLLDDYAQLSLPTATIQVDKSSKPEHDTGYLTSSSIRRT